MLENDASCSQDTSQFSSQKMRIKGRKVQDKLDGLEERLRKTYNFQMIPFDPSGEAEIQLLQGRVTAILEQAKHPADIKKRPRKSAEIAALVYHSDVLSRFTPVHIHDACCGGGILGFTIQHLRNDRPTSITGWDNDPTCKGRFERNRDQFTFNPEIHEATFQLGDISYADLCQVPDKTTVCMAKHACGDAADSLLTRIKEIATYTDVAPHTSIVLTCCHGTVRGSSPTSLITDNEWHFLTRTSDWISQQSPRIREIGRRSMRIVDALRAAVLSEAVPTLCTKAVEILPSDISAKNQAIIIQALK